MKTALKKEATSEEDGGVRAGAKSAVKPTRASRANRAVRGPGGLSVRLDVRALTVVVLNFTSPYVNFE